MIKSSIIFLFFFLSASFLFAQVQKGKASFYADKFEGRYTANGEIYKHSKMTAAHKILPFGTRVRVTNLKNNRSVIVRVNDRGPFIAGRIIDLSKSAAKKLHFINAGIAEVKIEIINGPMPKKAENLTPLMDSLKKK